MAYDTKESGLIERGRKEGLERAAKHVEAQKAVWGNTSIPTEHLLDMIAKNLRALKDYE